MLDLDKTYQPKRSGDYSNPRSTGDFLPIVYGDMTENAVRGVWKVPCIDKTNFIYAVAGCAILSEANGNSITVFDKNGNEISSSNYTFDESNNVEGLGAIATITFTTSYADSEPLTVKAKGRDDGSGSLLTNPSDIIEDFLTNIVGLSSNFIHAQSFAEVERQASSNGYSAAGLIDKEYRIGDVISNIISSFLGFWKLDSVTDRVFISLDIGLGLFFDSDIAAILREHETEEASLEVDDSDLCNQADAEWAYNWAEQTYEAGDDGSGSANTNSQAIYGTRIKKFQWPWVRSDVTAAALQSRIVSEFGVPVHKITAPKLGFEHIGVEVRDILMFSSSWLMDSDNNSLVNQFGRVISVQGDLNAKTMTLGFKDTGYFRTIAYLADGGEGAGDELMTQDGNFITTAAGVVIITSDSAGTRLADGSVLAGGERDASSY